MSGCSPSRPFQRVTRYTRSGPDSPLAPVSVLARGPQYGPHAGRAARLGSAHLFSLPFKNERRELENAVLGFASAEHARHYARALASDLRGAEGALPPPPLEVLTGTLLDASFYAHVLGLPLVVVHTCWCDSPAREPVLDVSILRDVHAAAPGEGGRPYGGRDMSW